MNNPVRAAMQRFVEAPLLRRMGGKVSGGRALELGCGQGVGTQIIRRHFEADRIDAFDLDPRMVLRASTRMKNSCAASTIWVGDATSLPLADASYEAVFDFGILHHVPRWRSAVSEIARVLKPGGRLYAEEPQSRFLAGPIMRRFFEHPVEDRFNHEEFCSVCHETGFEIVAAKEIRHRFSWIVARRR